MPNRVLKRALLAAVLVASATLGGCIVAPYPYPHRYAYYGPPAPVVVAPYYRPYYRY